MKKTLAFCVLAALLVAAAGAQALKDGTYFAQGAYDPNAGWKDMVTLVVKGGKIASADWDGVNLDYPMFKKDWAKAGKYGMLKASKLKKEWHEQAAAVEAFLVKNQNVNFDKFAPEGTTDAISGASMHVKGFFDLAKQAVAAGPVAKGKYKDGIWHAEAAAFPASGWKGTVDVFVRNGVIVQVGWNGVDKNGAIKRDAVKAGKYVMKEGGVSWIVQAAAVSAYITGTQDPAKIAFKDDAGHVDAISGVSISVKECFDLVAEALKKAK